ncbi:MAG: DUF4173 domain-containing protein [Clostridia bacterium]|nr:DUF4173 domain-containing protein [Clostridia bacterium]
MNEQQNPYYSADPEGQAQTTYQAPNQAPYRTPDQITYQTPTAKKPAREFTKKEKILVPVAVLAGYVFCRTFFVWQNPVLALVFIIFLFAFGFVFFGNRQRKPRSYFYPVSALVVASGLFLSCSPVLLLFELTYSLIAFFMFCQTGSETALEDHAGQLYVFETVKALFFSPFRNITASVQSIGSNKGGKKIGKTLLFVMAGIGVTIIPTAVVFWLLSYDMAFYEILEKITNSVFDEIVSRFWALFFGIPLGMFFYAAAYTGAHPSQDKFNSENCIKIENKIKFMPAVVGAVALVPMLFLYIVFIIAQLDYYKAVFTGVLPDAFTYAEFARDGFFRLCAVAAINAAALILIRIFTKKTAGGKISPIVKISTVILSLVTVIISVTAISQMLMYVSAYGLTRFRLYTLWFMALICLFFILAILKQFIDKLPFAASALVIFAVCFGLLAVPDTDAFIAGHNYNCYVSGSTNELDVNYLQELGPSAIPTVIRVAENESMDRLLREHAEKVIATFVTCHSDESVYAMNLPYIRAINACKEYKKG